MHRHNKEPRTASSLMVEFSIKGSNGFDKEGPDERGSASKLLATKPDNLSLVPGTHMAERAVCDMCMVTYTP